MKLTFLVPSASCFRLFQKRYCVDRFQVEKRECGVLLRRSEQVLCTSAKENRFEKQIFVIYCKNILFSGKFFLHEPGLNSFMIKFQVKSVKRLTAKTFKRSKDSDLYSVHTKA